METGLLILLVYQAPGSNALETADGVYKAMDELKKSFPKDIDYVVPFESVSVVKVSISEVVKTLLIALALVTWWCFFSSKLALYINSCAGYSCFYHRHFYIFYSAWLYNKYINHVWLCIGYWYRGR